MGMVSSPSQPGGQKVPQDVGISNKESLGQPEQDGSSTAGQDGSSSTEKLSIIVSTISEFLASDTLQSLGPERKQPHLHHGLLVPKM